MVLRVYAQRRLNLFSSPFVGALVLVHRNEIQRKMSGLALVHTYRKDMARPDIFLCISFLCTRTKAPTKGDENKLRRLCAYTLNTTNLVLVFTPAQDMRVISPLRFQ